MDDSKYFYVGLDVGRYSITACFMKNDGKVIMTFKFPNAHEGIRHFSKELEMCRRALSCIPILGAEGYNGHLKLLTSHVCKDDSIIFKNIQPIQVKEHKKIFVQMKKNDDYDAYIIADFLRTRQHQLQSLKQTNPRMVALKELSRMYQDFSKQMTKYINKLQQVLAEYLPDYLIKKPFSKFSCTSSLQLLAKYPSITQLKVLSLNELTEFLKKHSRGHSGQTKAEQIMDIVKDIEPPSEILESSIPIKISGLAQLILDLKQRLIELKKKLDDLQEPLREAEIVQSLPGAGPVLSARFLSEIESINRFKNQDAMALYCGLAPIDNSSGTIQRRRATYCVNKHAKNALMNIANCSVRVNPNSSSYLRRKIDEGRSYWDAIKCLARQILRTLYVMLKNNKTYLSTDLLCPDEEPQEELVPVGVDG